MDILILNWKDVKNPEAGGAEIIMHEFARRLVMEGNTVTILSRSYSHALPQEIIDKVRIIRKGNKYTSYYHAFNYYRKLKRKPEKVLDMVNTICWQTPLYVKSSKRVAYVNQLAKEVLFYELPWYISGIAYLLEKFEYIPYRNTKVLCYSHSTKSDLVSFGIPKGNIFVFPMGLDHSRYYPGNHKSSFPHFIFVGRLVKMKRPDVCIKAMKLVVRKYPESKLSIIGNGPEYSNLLSLVNKLSLESSIEFVNKNNFFIDKTKGDLKVKLMQEAWALLLPSIKEGWGMVITEAAACGTPAIVSRVTGLVDSVKHNKSGKILSRTPNETEIAACMVKIIEDSEMRNKLSKGAIELSKTLDWNRSYTRFKELFINS